MTGRLDLTDVTENGFYITRVGLTQEQLKMNKFPNISDIIENKCCPTLTLYFANFTDINNDYNGKCNLINISLYLYCSDNDYFALCLCGH